MKTILFKAKKTDGGEWIFGDLVYDAYDGSKIIKVGLKQKGCYPIEVIPETVCQYVGFYDIKCRMIFENDIVKYKYWDGQIRLDNEEEYRENEDTVKFSDGAYFPRPFVSECEDGFYSFGYYDFEVIGNLFDKENK